MPLQDGLGTPAHLGFNRRSTRTRAEAALVFNTVVWGSTFVLVKEALASVSTVLFLALRFSLAALALAVLFRRSWSHPRGLRRSIVGGIVAGAFLFAGYLFQTVGLRFTTAPKSAFLTGMTTVMVPLLALCVYRTRPRLLEIVGVLTAMVGMGLMTLPAGSWSIGRGDLITSLCAIAFAAHILTLGHFSGEASLEVLSVAQIATAAVLSLALFWWVETPYLHWRPALVYAILVTGLLATALAFTIQAWAQRHTTSTRTALIFTLEPVFAWITSFVLMGESLSERGAAGALLILGGVVMVEMKPWFRAQHPS
jgi:drug/metabolite transporter (DMT)-like permease